MTGVDTCEPLFSLLVNQSSLLWIVDDEAFATERVLEKLPLGGGDPPDARALPERTSRLVTTSCSS